MDANDQTSQSDKEVGYGIRDVWDDPIVVVEDWVASDGPSTHEAVILKELTLLPRDSLFHYKTVYGLLDQEASSFSRGLRTQIQDYRIRFTGVIDSDIDCTDFITTGTVVSGHSGDFRQFRLEIRLMHR
ncbi:hypothetical protein Tco_0909627 [Tanacetum coccineum]|uniref:Uncharacterized protein n=1 Tax=Tanacetum coccineum TaxID=301880 RepID=A0ABQ5CSA2_9ASTR